MSSLEKPFADLFDHLVNTFFGDIEDDELFDYAESLGIPSKDVERYSAFRFKKPVEELTEEERTYIEKWLTRIRNERSKTDKPFPY
jgi:hypothetical protein